MKNEAHLIVQEIKRLKALLGRTPSKADFVNYSDITYHQMRKVFGSYVMALQAANQKVLPGTTNKVMRDLGQKKDRQEIRKKAFEHLKKEVEAKKRIVKSAKISDRVLIIGDTHVPYQHPDAIAWLVALGRKYKFDRVLHAGDEVDFHAMSFHDSDPDLHSAGHELEAAIEALQPLYKAFPVMTLAESNHGSLVYRKGRHHGFPRHVLKSYREILEAPPGWEWEEKIHFQTTGGVENLLVHSLGVNVLQVSKFKGVNVIQGHHHSLFSTQAWNNEKRSFFGAQAGCLIDDLSYAMAYNKTTKERPIMGSIAILDGVPKLLPMFLDAKGRWNGKLP